MMVTHAVGGRLNYRRVVFVQSGICSASAIWNAAAVQNALALFSRNQFLLLKILTTRSQHYQALCILRSECQIFPICSSHRQPIGVITELARKVFWKHLHKSCTWLSCFFAICKLSGRRWMLQKLTTWSSSSFSDENCLRNWKWMGPVPPVPLLCTSYRIGEIQSQRNI